MDSERNSERKAERKAAITATIAVIVVILLISAVGLLWNRVASPFQEETRRITYQESVTAQAACRKNLNDLYKSWMSAGDGHKGAIEAMAKDEAARVRCDELQPEVRSWLNALSY